jgi:very-long-chain (3R)-3-hydroxyacyl-CoA dehydratase
MQLKQAYLLAYNGSMGVGWGIVLGNLARHLASGGSVTTAHPKVASLTALLLHVSAAEIVHAATKLVKSPLATTVVQIMGRLAVLYAAVREGPVAVTKSTWVTQMIGAWACSEVIRYSFYAVNLVGTAPKWLVWLRYSAFALLYPVGFAGEIGCLVKALPHLEATGKFSVALPNKYNFAFHFPSFLWLLFATAYPAGFYTLMAYMVKQRGKVLGKRA